MAVTVPESLAQTLSAAVLGPLFEALTPGERLAEDIEVEIEDDDDGTWTLVYAGKELTARKGFADDEPFFSAQLPSGGFAPIARLLQAAVDGFPQAPHMSARFKASQQLGAKELQQAFDGIKKLKDCAITVEVKGVGTYRMARGALDEATRELKVTLDQKTVDDALAGKLNDPLAAAKVSGDKRLQGDLVAALGSAWVKIRQAG